jgi:nucleotide-binding universal stress UspA family protein
MEPVRAEARSYLKEVLGRVKAKGLTVSSKVREGNPAEEIIAFAEESGSDMVAMATHGRSGIERWVMGSVADKVIRSGTTKVMLVSAP